VAMSKSTENVEIIINPIKQETMELAILGTTPIILNRLADKARRELLLPGGRKTAADRAATPKHDPIAEFRASPYILPNDDAPTYIAHMSSAFKNAMMDAALEVPGARKAQIGRLVWVPGMYVSIYGIPELLMSVVRMADINHTPDIHTRVIIPKWAATLVVNFTVPMIKQRSILNLLAAAGIISGVGDWRTGKGKGNHGQFVVTDFEDAQFKDIVATGGRAAQIAAMNDPAPYDQESEEMLSWFVETSKSRGLLRSVA
jgi:hypothetical protein